MPRPTTLEALRAADEHLTHALTCLQDARESELASARALPGNMTSEQQDAHARHLLCNSVLILAQVRAMWQSRGWR